MVGRKLDYSSVPTAPELENNSNQKKYTVNRGSKGDLSISKPVCALFVMGALLLAAVAAVVTYFLIPCDGTSLPESFTKTTEKITTEVPVIDYVRLPRSIEPTHYRLFIAPELAGNFTTSGNVTIRLKIKDDTNDISLNALDLDIDKNSVFVRKIKDGKEIPVSKQDYDEYGQIYTVTLKEYLTPNEEYELFMKFNGTLNDFMVGFYRSHYEDVNKTTRWIASTQFSPTDARRAFPCFDEPSFKAKFRISIRREQHMQSLSNMEKESTTKENNAYWDHYHETPIMSSYLVAFTVHDFVPYQSSAKNFTIWARQDRIRQGVYAGEIGPKVLKFYENYFDLKFPLPKIDLVAMPDFGFSAMENWGLITFRESKLLYDDQTSTAANKRDLALTLSHELAHQWFGNLVTPKWWDDLWMKEGFSTYFQFLGVHEVEPTWPILDEFYQLQTIKAFEIDKLSSSRPIHFNVQNSNDIRQVFDQISYSKGASLVKMLSSMLGPDTFQKGLRKFLMEKQYSNANNVDLWQILNEESKDVLAGNASVKEVMVSWMTQPGFPVVTVVADRTKNELHLSQKRFLMNGNTKSSEKWWIPISYTSPHQLNYEDSKPKAWLHGDDSLKVSLNLSSWYLINLKQTGYYVVNYDEVNWKLIIEDIMNMPPTTRAQLVSDSMALAKAGFLDYTIPLNMITKIVINDEEINYITLMAIFEKTDYLHNMLMSTPAFGKFELFFLDIFNTFFEVVQFGEGPTDNYLTKRIRSIVQEQSCRKPDTRCAIDARLRYRNWMANTVANTIPPSEREIIYCTAIREGGDAEWNAAYEAYKNARSAADKFILLKSLGCSSKQWVLAKYLDMMLSNSSGVRKQDGSDMFHAVASNFHGYTLAFDFLRNNWDQINEYYGEAFRTVSKMVESLPTFMNTHHQLQQLEAFKKENKYNLKATQQAFDNAIEIVKSNVEWVKTNYKSVDDWLTEHLKHFNYMKK